MNQTCALRTIQFLCCPQLGAGDSLSKNATKNWSVIGGPRFALCTRNATGQPYVKLLTIKLASSDIGALRIVAVLEHGSLHSIQCIHLSSCEVRLPYWCTMTRRAPCGANKLSEYIALFYLAQQFIVKYVFR